jgi:hypothetical protein
MNTFLSADGKASRTTILGSRMGSAGLWVATSVQLTNQDANLPAYLAATIQVGCTCGRREARIVKAAGSMLYVTLVRHAVSGCHGITSSTPATPGSALQAVSKTSTRGHA